MASVPEIVRFLNSYKEMTPVQKTEPETLQQVDKIKELIEKNLKVNLFMSLGHAVNLTQNSGDEVWMQRLVAQAEPLTVGLDEDDKEDLQHIFIKYLGRRL